MAFVPYAPLALSSNGRSRTHGRPVTLLRPSFNQLRRVHPCPVGVPRMGASGPGPEQGGGGGGGGGPPVNAPSGVLLGTSSILAIAAVGSVFELTSGHPTYGATVTKALLAVALPGFLFLFYAAIRKGQQEAMDDP